MKKLIILFLLSCACACAAVDDSYTKSLLHLNTDFADEAGKAWTPVGSAIATTTDPKFGAGCLYLGGSPDCLTGENSADFDFGSGDFTIDWWEKTSGASHLIFSRDQGNGGTYTPYGILDANLRMSSNGSSWDIVSAPTIGTVDAGAWTHMAIVRSGNNFYVFKNGEQASTWSSAAAPYAGESVFSLGRDRSGIFGTFTGYVDEFRISKGIARWTAGFSVPTSEYGVNVPAKIICLGTINFSGNGVVRFAP